LPHIFLDGYCSTVQGLLDWFEVDLGFTELLFIQKDLCVTFVLVLYSPVSLSSCPFFGHPALPPPRGGSAVGVPRESVAMILASCHTFEERQWQGLSSLATH